MYFLFLWEVLKRAFSPTARVTDVLQILAASTLPAIGKFAGVRLPASASNDVLAYIGLIAVSFIAIRLLWAPYSLWKEQAGEIGSLKLELTKPERLVLQHQAKLQAKARRALSGRLHKMHLASFKDDKPVGLGLIAKHLHYSQRLAHAAGLPKSFADALRVFDELCELRLVDKLEGQEDYDALDLMQRFLVGQITAEALVLQLPQGTGAETQP